MTKYAALLVVAAGCLLQPPASLAQHPHPVVYQGDTGPGRGKHIVWLAGDHEYRGEESLPALARIMAKHYGFKCSVFFTTDPKTGFIEPGSSNISGLEALETADLLVVFLRFQDFPDDQMQHIVDYLDRGGPVVGYRTATHAFQIKRPDAKFLKYTWNNTSPDYTGGFGRRCSARPGSRTTAATTSRARGCCCNPKASHPILRGVKDVWVQSGGYTADPIAGSHGPGAGPDPERNDRGLAARAGQEAGAGRVVSDLRALRENRGACSRRRTARPKTAERRIPAHGRQRDAVGGRTRDSIRPDGPISSSAPSIRRRLPSTGSSRA